MPEDFKTADHGLRKLSVTTHRGVVFASYCETTWSRSRTISGPKCCASSRRRSTAASSTMLGYYRHSLPGNWKLYHENLKDPYHATLLHTFLVTFGLLVAGTIAR